MGLLSQITLRGLIRFGLRRLVEGIVLLIIFYYLPNIPPFCKIETPYKVAKILPLEGKLALNEKLANIEFWHFDNIEGPESFASFNGELYTGVQSGEIVKLTGEKHVTPIAKFGKVCKAYEESKCGRPLGLQFDESGTLYAIDAYYGIFTVNVQTGEKKQLVSPEVEINGVKPKIFNSIAVAKSGEVYWTHSSSEFGLDDAVFDLLADGSGRLLKYDPKTRRNTVLMENLHFPNGVLLTQSEDAVIMSETNRNMLHKYYLRGSKAGEHEVLIEGLPGTPDNLRSDGSGGLFVSFPFSHDADYPNVIQIFGPFPWMRKLIARSIGMFQFAFKVFDYIYPNEFAKYGILWVGHTSIPTKYLRLSSRSTIMRLTENGDILDSYHTENRKVYGISEAFIYKDHLLLGSPFNNYIGRVPLKELGINPKPVAQPTQAPKTQTTAPKPSPPSPQPTKAATETPKTTRSPQKPQEAQVKPTVQPTAQTQPPKTQTASQKPTGAKKDEL